MSNRRTCPGGEALWCPNGTKSVSHSSSPRRGTDHSTWIFEKPSFTDASFSWAYWCTIRQQWGTKLPHFLSCCRSREVNSLRGDVAAAKQAEKRPRSRSEATTLINVCLQEKIYIPCLYQEPEVKYWPLWSWWQISHNQDFILVPFCRLICDLCHVNSKGKLKCSESGKIFYRTR